MTGRFRRAAVIGAGVMGAQIAAHLANAGVPTLLLDVKPDSMTDEERARGASLSDPAVANRNSIRGLEAAKRARPAAFMNPRNAALIEVGNLDDDLEKLEGADWVIEAIVENLDIKRDLYARIAPYLDLRAILTSNTSGLSVAALSDALPAGIRPRFLVTHFFNPPRYLELLEIVAAPETDPEVTRAVTEFGRARLGKGIVVAKDTPNFIANRIGVFSLMDAVHRTLEMGLSLTAVDALTGPLIGRPKSATFRTADVVGLDTLSYVSTGLVERIAEDPDRERIRAPKLLDDLVAAGALGQKTRQGFYKKDRERGILEVDPKTLEYREPVEKTLPELAAVRGIADPFERVRQVAFGKGRASEFLWGNLSATMRYAARLVPEIADDVAAVDDAMRWGFGWTIGPFALWDALGVETVRDRMKSEGTDVPELVAALEARPQKSFFVEAGEQRLAFSGSSGTHIPHSKPADERSVGDAARGGHVVEEYDAARLVDFGEDVLVLELTTKRGTISDAAIEAIIAAVERTENTARGLVIGGDGEHFSAGADLRGIVSAIESGDLDTVDGAVHRFQTMVQCVRTSARPVVTALRGQVLGGGCEVALASARRVAAAETYIGLVELGAGVIPAGGGCKELLRHVDEKISRAVETDLFPFVRRIFEVVGTASVSSSAADAVQLGFLQPSDLIVPNSRAVVAHAVRAVIALDEEGFVPVVPRTDIRVVGSNGLATIRSALHNFSQARHISPYDGVVADQLARVLCGGDIDGAAEVSEAYLLEREREAFVECCRDERTLARMKSLLDTGRPLRN